MKKFIFVAATAMFAIACGNGSTSTPAGSDSVTGAGMDTATTTVPMTTDTMTTMPIDSTHTMDSTKPMK